MNKQETYKRKTIVKNELVKLVEKSYISKEEYDHILNQYQNYYDDLDEQLVTTKLHHEETKYQQQQAETSAQPTPKKIKPKRSKENQRERNITWILILGVIMLLISGLFLATSAWDSLNNSMKTLIITFVSVFFYVLSFISIKVFKIDKTAFAFNILGSLFLPIIVISIGYLELFGNYFSLFGDGKYLFSATGSLIILPIYLYFSFQLTSRLYVWLSYLTFSLLIGFLLAACQLPIDGFYLGIMLFNALLIFIYTRIKSNKKINIFIHEFIPYIQINLILSSLLLLTFYQHEAFHGFNLMMTAIIYFSMIFVTNHKSYHFVFTAMLVYGVYQVIEFSGLQEFGALGYAVLGFIFLGLPLFINKDNSLRKVFHFTSAIVSGLAFIYITLQAILLRADYPSFVMLLAYIVIALNFIYLANRTKKRLFTYLAPIFILVAFREVIVLSENLINYENLILPMFFASFILYVVIGCLNKLTFLHSINHSSRDIAILGLVIFFLAEVEIVRLNYLNISMMLFTLSVVSLLMYYFENRKKFPKLQISSWAFPLTLGFAMHMLFLEIVEITLNNDLFMVPYGLALSGFFILGVSYIWKKYHFNSFSQQSFYVAQFIYFIGLIVSFNFQFELIDRNIIVFGSILMAYLFYKKVKHKMATYLVSGTTLLFYFTLLNLSHHQFIIDNIIFLSLQLVIAAAILLFIGYIIKKYDQNLKTAFYVVAHLYLPIAIIISLILTFDDSFWMFAFITVLYVLSFLQSFIKIMSVLFLYVAYTTALLMFIFYLNLIEFESYNHYVFIFMSMIIAINWFFAKGNWVNIIALYLIPFSLFGHLMVISSFEIDVQLLMIIFIYTAGILYVLFKQKLTILNVIPLFLNIFPIYIFSDGNYFIALIGTIIYAIILISIGLWQYKSLYNFGKNFHISIDWYTIISFLTLSTTLLIDKQFLWEKVLPGLLIALFTFLQRNRVDHLKSKWIRLIGGFFLLQPYYTLLTNISIPALFIRELQVLPWVLLSILLKRVANEKHHNKVNYIQWAVLVVVSLLLVQDGLASNTVYDAIIIGSLSLLAIIYGFTFKTKAFFFVGSGVLLLNILIQTRPFWGNMPWWAYLLIAGTILIVVASMNEWQKQKAKEGKQTFIKTLYTNAITKLKKWE